MRRASHLVAVPVASAFALLPHALFSLRLTFVSFSLMSHHALLLPGKVKAYELRGKGKEELLKQLEELKNELAQLKVAKVSGGPASKLTKMCVPIAFLRKMRCTHLFAHP